jgi:hypothetical protein
MIADWCDVGKVTVNVLPDDVLLGVFDCYVDEATELEAWHTPVMCANDGEVLSLDHCVA